MRSRIIGTGSCLPETVVTNDWLSTIMDTSDEWIASRTGIRERRLVKEETTAGLSVQASREALKAAGVDARELDLIVVGTITGDYVTPSTACEIQAALGADRAVAFDVNAACSGFLFSLMTADSFLNQPKFKTALVVGAETLSRIMDWTDRGTCVLFGDGAGAAVIRAADAAAVSYTATTGDVQQSGGILSYDLGSDGGKGMCLSCKGRENNNPLVHSAMDHDYVHMDGQEVYKFAVTVVPASIQKALDEAGVCTEDVKYFLLHQANLRIIQSVAKRMKQPMEKFPISLDHCGNISAASVPILLDEVNRDGKLVRGDKIVLCGFGAGLTWGTAVVEW